MEWNQHSLEPCHLGVLSAASKIISEPMVHLAQTMHLSCTDTNTVSKRTKTRFHMTHISKEFHPMRPKWFLCLWYVRCKPCTYLASRLALSPNGLNRASTWASSPRSTIRCVKMISEPMLCFAETVHPSCFKISIISKQTETSIQLSLVC
jgi:hypothetical protein